MGLIRLLFFLGNPEKEKGRNMKLEIKTDNLRDVYFNYSDVEKFRRWKKNPNVSDSVKKKHMILE